MQTRCSAMLKVTTKYLLCTFGCLKLINIYYKTILLGCVDISVILLFHQSISGGRSFAEILFGGVDNGSLGEKELLDRGVSLHKVPLSFIYHFPNLAYLYHDEDTTVE